MLKFLKKFPNAEIINMYGCTENSPRISYYKINNNDKKYVNKHYYPVGKSVDGTKIKIDSNGEILIKGDSLFLGYLNDKSKTLERFVNGWFKTQDLGHVDAYGNLFITGRLDAMINVGNEKVSPENVEQVICKLNGVHECFVYGAENIILGQEVRADIVRTEGVNLSIDDILIFCRNNLSSFKIPRKIRFVESVPKTDYGKIDRKKKKDGVL